MEHSVDLHCACPLRRASLLRSASGHDDLVGARRRRDSSCCHCSFSSGSGPCSFSSGGEESSTSSNEHAVSRSGGEAEFCQAAQGWLYNLLPQRQAMASRAACGREEDVEPAPQAPRVHRAHGGHLCFDNPLCSRKCNPQLVGVRHVPSSCQFLRHLHPDADNRLLCAERSRNVPRMRVRLRFGVGRGRDHARRGRQHRQRGGIGLAARPVAPPHDRLHRRRTSLHSRGKEDAALLRRQRRIQWARPGAKEARPELYAQCAVRHVVSPSP